MESAIGALGSPNDVFKLRYADFIDNLASNSSSFSFALLAAYVDRLTPDMFHSVHQKIQGKLIEASRLPSSQGISHFAWSVYRKHPKIFGYNAEAFRVITWKSLERVFLDRFLNGLEDNDDCFEVPFTLFATLFGNEWKTVLSTVTVVAKKKPPYKQDGILDLKFMNEIGSGWKNQLLCFLWSLIDTCVQVSPKIKVNTQFLVKVAEYCFQLNIEEVTCRIFDVFLSVSSMMKTNFAIYIDSILSALQLHSIPSKPLYIFLGSLLERNGGIADISKNYQALMIKFAYAIGSKVSQEELNDCLIGRSEVMDIINGLDDDNCEGIEAFDDLFDLIITILETIPSSIPPKIIQKIQQGICSKILLADMPAERDLRLLNALLAVKNELIPSPLQVAQTVYNWPFICNNDELFEVVKIGKSLCDVHRSIKINAFTLDTIQGSKDSAEETFTHDVSVNNFQTPKPSNSEEVALEESNQDMEIEAISNDVDDKTPVVSSPLAAENENSPSPIKDSSLATEKENTQSSIKDSSPLVTKKGNSPSTIKEVEKALPSDKPLVESASKVSASSSGGSLISEIPKVGQQSVNIMDSDDDDCVIIDTPVKTTTTSNVGPITSTPVPGEKRKVVEPKKADSKKSKIFEMLNDLVFE